MTHGLADCLLQVGWAGALELDKRQGELSSGIAVCRAAGWVEVCRDPDGSISVGKRFGAVYTLSPAGREVLAEYRKVVAEAASKAKAKVKAKGDDDGADAVRAPYTEYVHEQLVKITPGEYTQAFS